jgi:glycosyltransferase involved in cell wall biosynthesis
MKISVAVPSYNYARFLPACLDSIRQQQHEDFEVLIADGGSTDGSIEIIQSYCEADSRFRLVSRQDKGQADAIRQAFAEASGEILCFLNADDCYLNDRVFNTVLETFERQPGVSVASYGGYYLDADGRRIKRINYRYHPLDGFHWMRYRTAVIQPATFWLKHVYDEAGWPSNFHFVFDVVFFYNTYLHYQWAESDVSVAGYRLHGDNKSMSVRSRRVMELAAFEEIKFGVGCFRARYLRLVGRLVERTEGRGAAGELLSRGLYVLINSLAFLSFYRMPGI